MNVEEVYKKVYCSCVQFAVYQKKNVIENLGKLFPALSEFVDEFLSKNCFHLEYEDYQLSKRLLLDILSDIVQGMEQRDTVLLEDTIEYGLKEFLELFIVDEQDLMRIREESMNEQGNL